MNIGIIGLGHIARKMADTVNKLDGFTLEAVASRSLDKAISFKDEFKANKAYGSYEDLMKDDSIDLVYIATPHSSHLADMELALKYNKNVLCEKILTTRSKDSIYIYKKFEEKGLFLAEALWTSYMPVNHYLKELINSKKYREVTSVDAYFEINIASKERILKKELGGGVAMDLGVYPISFVYRLFGFNYNKFEIKEVKMLGDVDINELVEIHYDDFKATCHIKGDIEAKKELVINTKNASIHVNSICGPSLITIYDLNENVIETYDCTCPYGGFEYELIESKQAILNKKTEPASWSHKDSVLLAKDIDKILNFNN